jgi:hypothetical protein
MWAYQYKHGDRPLDGYTILRAAGRGGFGEVYEAVSDSGREVALKAILGYEQIELRGIAHCMNLKSPHLVNVFDVRHNAAGRPFLIMEYVAGPSLRELIDAAPAGLGTQKAAFFLREIAKGLTYLHDRGIVHRDLKPGNIFFEHGYVKIGDYGLSKAIATSHHSGQTVTVGTVHYMAPEIGGGRYDRGVDVYALGALLYEMLTGTVPYVGSSPTEILLKHLSAEPDVTHVPEPFATVVKRAMCKDPDQRYRSAQEMVEAVFGAEHVRQSVSVFAPEELSVVAERAARLVTAGTAAPAGVGAGGDGAVFGAAAANGAAAAGLMGGPAESSSVSVTGGGGAAAGRPDFWQRLAGAVDRVVSYEDRDPPPAPAAPRPPVPPPAPAKPPAARHDDPIPKRQRRMLAAVVSAVIAIAAGVLASDRYWDGPAGPMLFVFLGIWGGVLGLLFASRSLRNLPSHVAVPSGRPRDARPQGVPARRQAAWGEQGSGPAAAPAAVGGVRRRARRVGRGRPVRRQRRRGVRRVDRRVRCADVVRHGRLGGGRPPGPGADRTAAAGGAARVRRRTGLWVHPAPGLGDGGRHLHDGPGAGAVAAGGRGHRPACWPSRQRPARGAHPALPGRGRGRRATDRSAGAAAARRGGLARLRRDAGLAVRERCGAGRAAAGADRVDRQHAGLDRRRDGPAVGHAGRPAAVLLPELRRGGLAGRELAAEMQLQEASHPGWSFRRPPGRDGRHPADRDGGAALLLIGRRRHGWAHNLRGLLAAAAMVLSVFVIGASVPRQRPTASPIPGPGLTPTVVIGAAPTPMTALNAALEPDSILPAAGLFLGGVVLLVWPATRGRSAGAEPAASAAGASPS